MTALCFFLQAIPDRNLKINTVVSSFVGAAVENAELAIVWSIEGEYHC